MDKKYTDMHIHTAQSNDGRSSVKRILNGAISEGLKTVSITDHNNIKNTEKALRLSKLDQYKDLNIISGVEITCKHPTLKKSIHLLLYDFKTTDPKLNDIVMRVSEQEKAKKYEVITNLEKGLGIDLNYFSVMKYLNGVSDIKEETIIDLLAYNFNNNKNYENYEKVSNRDVRSFLNKIASTSNKERGVNKELKTFPNTSFFNHKKKIKQSHDFNAQYPSLSEVLDAAKSSGAIPCIAHPDHLKFKNKSQSWKENFDEFLDEFNQLCQSRGLKPAIEAYHPSSVVTRLSKNITDAELENKADKLNFLTSAGSDFHELKANDKFGLGQVGDNKFSKTSLEEYILNGRPVNYQTHSANIDTIIQPVNRRSKLTLEKNEKKQNPSYKKPTKVILENFENIKKLKQRVLVNKKNIKFYVKELNSKKTSIDELSNMLDSLKRNLQEFESLILSISSEVKEHKNYKNKELSYIKRLNAKMPTIEKDIKHRLEKSKENELEL